MKDKQFDNLETDDVKVVCLMTFLRAGSKLFHSLLDGHPQVLLFSRTLQFNRFWQGIGSKKDDPEYVVDIFIKKYPRFFSGESWYRFNKFDRADQLGAKGNETFNIDTYLFKKLALKELDNKHLTRRQYFLGLNFAYHKASGREIENNHIILNHIHDIDFHDELSACLEDFPRAKLIVTTRHPIDGFNSCFKWMRMQNTLSCIEMFHHYKQGINGTERLMRQFPDLDVRVIPYEELNGKIEQVMRAFISWVDIDWNECLTKPTLQGKVWRGNGKNPQDGPAKNIRIYEPNGFFEKKDWILMTSFFKERLKSYGYVDKNCYIFKPKGFWLIICLLLPMSNEMAILKCFFSPSYWLEVICDIRKELNDPRLKGYDFLSKGRLSGSKRWFGKFCEHFKMISPVKWCQFVVKRAMYFYYFIKECEERKEMLPVSLVEYNTNDAKG